MDFKGIALDECSKCSGRWFDRHELRKAKDKTDDDLRWLDFDLFDEEADKFAVAKANEQCPKCSIKMDSLTYENSGIVIDRCTRCKGVWLDNGEFEKIVEYLDNLVNTKPVSEYAGDVLEEFLEIAVGPENKVSEVRDFLAVLRLFQMRIVAGNPKMQEAILRISQASPLK